MVEAMSREGSVDVPGARLRYRLAGTPGEPLLVFENGWGASYEQWAWVERELAPHAQLLFYDRAGIGGSVRLEPQTVAGLSAHFAALPASLGLHGPVIAVGHSYGGLMCSLHAAQRRDAVQAVVEIDSTPERGDIDADSGLRSLPKLIALIRGGLRLGIPNVAFGGLAKKLPPDAGRSLMRIALSNRASLQAGLDEFAMLHEIRAAIAIGRPQDFSRLLIAAGTPAKHEGLLSRILVSRARVQSVFARNGQMQRERTTRDAGCRLQPLPYDHSDLVFDPNGARETAASIRQFVRDLESVPA